MTLQKNRIAFSLAGAQLFAFLAGSGLSFFVCVFLAGCGAASFIWGGGGGGIITSFRSRPMMLRS